MAVQKVWSKFSVIKNNDKLNLKIVDLPENRSLELVQLYIKYFVPQESSFISAGVPQNIDAVNEYKEKFNLLLNSDVSHAVICCEDHGDDEIGEFIGGSAMFLNSRDENVAATLKHETKELKLFMEMMKYSSTLYSPFNEYDIEKFYNGCGVVVHPDYRGCGIAQEFLRTRPIICKEHDVPLTGAWMTAIGTQKAGQRCGWQTAYELNKLEVNKKFGVSYIPSPVISLYMITKP